MKRLFAAMLLVMAVAACQTVPQQPPDPADVAAAICPPLQTALSVLAAPGLLDPAAEVAVAVPLVAAVCAAGQSVLLADLHSLAAAGLPALAKVAQSVPIDDGDRRAVIISLAVAQAAIAAIGRGQ